MNGWLLTYIIWKVILLTIQLVNHGKPLITDYDFKFASIVEGLEIFVVIMAVHTILW